MDEPIQEIELTESQLRKIKLYLDDSGALYRAAGSSLTKRRHSPQARLLVSGHVDTVVRALRERVSSSGLKEKLHDLMCKKFDWCKRKKEKLYNLVVAVARIILPIINSLGGAIANIVLLVKRDLLDHYCECEKKTVAQI